LALTSPRSIQGVGEKKGRFIAWLISEDVQNGMIQAELSLQFIGAFDRQAIDCQFDDFRTLVAQFESGGADNGALSRARIADKQDGFLPPRGDNGIGSLAINLDDETVDLGFFQMLQVAPAYGRCTGGAC
jgi:hypothetical protein